MFRGGVLANDQSLLHNGDSELQLRRGCRIVLDLMPEDPDPIKPGSQGSVVDYDGAGDALVDWDESVGRSLHLIPGVDRWHVIDSHNPDEMRRSWENLKLIQQKVGKGDSSRCPRCGQLFDVHRGAVSRRINYTNIMVCDLCGVQEAVEDFVLNGAAYGCDVSVFVPEGVNKTGFETEPQVSGNYESNEESSKATGTGTVLESLVSNDLVSHKRRDSLDDIDNNSCNSVNSESAAEGVKEQKREKLKIRILPLTDWYIVKVWTGRLSPESVEIKEVAE